MGKLFDVLALLADQGPDSLSWNKKVGYLLLLSLGKSKHSIKINNWCVNYVPDGGLERPGPPTVGGAYRVLVGDGTCWRNPVQAAGM